MDLEKFKAMIENLASHPKVKQKLDDLRSNSGASDGRDGKGSDQSPGSKSYTVTLLEGLAMLETAAALLPIGRKAKQIAMIIGLIGVLIELSILFKQKVLDDPDVQKRMQDAWAELEHQSGMLFSGAQTLLERVMTQIKSLKS